MSRLSILFDEAKAHVHRLELQVQQLERASKLKERVLQLLQAEAPLVWITGPNREKLRSHIAPEDMLDSSVEEFDFFPLALDTKYYKVEALVSAGSIPVLQSKHHAVVLAFDADFDLAVAAEVFSNSSEVRLCVCDDHSTGLWCAENGVEWVEWDAVSRLMEALTSSVWPNMTLKQAVRSQENPTVKSDNRNSDAKRKQKSGSLENESYGEASLDMFETLMSRAREVQSNAYNLPDDLRRQRAAQAAEAMIKLLGIEEDEDEDEEF